MRTVCAACQSDAIQSWFRKGDYEIQRCERCGLAFWLPSEDFDPAALYDADYFEDGGVASGYDDYEALEPCLRRTFERRLSRIPMPHPGARLLDVGAAFGFAVAEARRQGWQSLGLEVGAKAARRAGAETPGRIVHADGRAMPFATGSFDVVTLWDVIEHLPDPQSAIGEVARVLRPGGRLVMTTGDVDSLVARLSGSMWHLFNLPEHLFFYNRRSLSRLLDEHHFRIERIAPEPSYYTLGYLVERIRKTMWHRIPRAGTRWPGSGILVPLSLFDILTVVAVREEAP